MSTVIAELPVAKDGILISVTEDTIAKMALEYGSLTINGVDDKKGFLAVDTARKACVKARGVINTEHKELKEDALRVCQALDAAKRNLTAKIEAIEGRLKDEIDAVEKERERIEQAKQDEIYRTRLDRWNEAGGGMTDRAYLLSHNPETFDILIENVTTKTQQRKEAEAKAAAEEAEQKRIQAEQAEANRIEAERLKAEREELARQKAEQDAETARLKKIEDDRIAADRAELKRQQDELQAEKDRLASEERERQRLARMEDERLAQIERDREVEEKRKAHEAELAAERAVEALRAEQMKPIAKKILDFADKIELTPIPDIPEQWARAIQEELQTCAGRIRKCADLL